MENSEQQWIASDEPPPYEIVNPNGRSRAILTCDHASLRIPRRLGTLGLGPQDLERHIAWDIGAELVARRLTEILDAPPTPRRVRGLDRRLGLRHRQLFPFHQQDFPEHPEVNSKLVHQRRGWHLRRLRLLLGSSRHIGQKNRTPV